MSKAREHRPAPRMRCAIYTRKSTEEGLDKDFNSLDAQREAGEAYIKSQAHEGWTLLPTRYDDGGFTGGNMDRPALRRLLSDIAAGKVDAVVTYKVDRLSRSLLDFARIIQLFDEHRVSFVSVTQQFNTATSMGRLVLNVLLSFAQFEREIISERTRDKIAAARRKGKWTGGRPLLGYDVDPITFKLLVNEAEAKQVRVIFELYLEQPGLISLLREVQKRGWRTKQWQSRKGRTLGGKPYCKTSLRQLLSNPVYVGKVKYKKELHTGEHPGIVDPGVWQRVQERREAHGRAQRKAERMSSRSALQGLLYCAQCACRMTPTHANGRGGKRYDYYTCLRAVTHGREACSSRRLSARGIERFVWEQLLARTSETMPSSGAGRARQPRAPLISPTMPAGERVAAMRALVRRVEYDGVRSRVVISLNEQAGKVSSASSNGETRDVAARCDH